MVLSLPDSVLKYASDPKSVWSPFFSTHTIEGRVELARLPSGIPPF